MLVPARAVDVAVGELFFARLAHLDHLDGEVERDACERVVPVEGDVRVCEKVRYKNVVPVYLLRAHRRLPIWGVAARFNR